MHKLRVIGVLVGMLLGLPAMSGAVEVRFIAYNIYTYGDPGTPGYESLVRIIEALQPDVLLIQEANNDAGRAQFMNYFSDDFPYSFLGAPSSGNPRNQILSRFPLSNGTEIWTEGFSRPVVRADVDIDCTADGTELRVYSAHWKSGTSPEDAQIRIDEANDTVDDIEAFLAADPNGEIVHGGDLNDEPGGLAFNILGGPTTGLNRQVLTDPHTGSQMTRPASGRILDHFFITQSLEDDINDMFVFRTDTYGNPPYPPEPAQEDDSLTASDHLTLVLDLDFPDIPTPTDVVINEVFVTQYPDTDTHEFIELYGTPNTCLIEYKIIVIEGDGSSKGIIDDVIHLSDQKLNEDGFFVAGSSNVNPDMSLGWNNIFENGTETFLLVKNFNSWKGTDIDEDDDRVADFSIGDVIDSIGIGDNGMLNQNDAVYYDAPVFGPDGISLPPGCARIEDGVDTDTVDDWIQLSRVLDGSDGDKAITPGSSNSAMPGDCDDDGDVDLQDFFAFQTCFTGPVGPVAPGCECVDFNSDDDVDLQDFLAFQTSFTGPG